MALIDFAVEGLNVAVRELPEDDNSAQYVDEDNRMQVHYMAYNNYDHREGVYMLGVTSPEGFGGQRAAFVQLCAPTEIWVFRWTAACYGDKPRVPDPTPLNPDWVLLQRLPELPIHTVGVDGETPLRRVTGTYVYGKKSASNDPFKDASFPRPAFLEDTFDRVTGNLEYEKGLGDAGAGAAAGAVGAMAALAAAGVGGVEKPGKFGR